MTVAEPTESTRSRRNLTFALAGLAALAVVAQVRIYPPDCAYYYAYAHSLLYDADLLFDNQYEAFPFQPYEFYLSPQGVPANDWPVGTGIVWLAALAWIRLGQFLAEPLGLVSRGTGFEAASKLAATLVSSLLGLLAVTVPLIMRKDWIRDRGLSRSQAIWLWAAILCGTPFGYCLIVFPANSHIPSAAFLACTLGAWWRWRREGQAGGAASTTPRQRMGWAILTGLSVGMLLCIRPQNAVFGIVPLLDLALNRDRGKRLPRLPEGAVALVAAFLAVLPQLFVWRTLYGDWMALPKIEEMHWLQPNLLSLLFSSYHGYLSWAPLCLLALLGLAIRRANWPYLAGVLAQIYVNACNEWWWAGGSFSQRRMVGCTPLLLIGLWTLWTQLPTAKLRRAAIGLSLACSAWTFALLLTEVGGGMRLDHAIPWSGILGALPNGIFAGIRDFVPRFEWWYEPWARVAVPLWIGVGVWAGFRGWDALARRWPGSDTVRPVAGVSVILVLGLVFLFGMSAARTPGALAKSTLMVDRSWPTHSRFRWVYRFEEGHMYLARKQPWQAIDALLASERIFDGYYQSWRATGHALLQVGQPYSAYFAWKESISRGDRTDSLPRLEDLLRYLLETHSEKKVVWWNDLGVVKIKLGKEAEAKAHFESALALDPDYRPAQSNLRKFEAEIAPKLENRPEDVRSSKESWTWE